MAVRAYAVALQALAEGRRRWLSIVMRDDHRSHHEAAPLEFPAQAYHILVVGDAQVGAGLVLLDVGGTDYDDYLDAVTQFPEHAQLAVGQEPRQHTAGMVVVKEFPAQFEVEFPVEARDALPDVFRLYALILPVVKSCSHNTLFSPCKITKISLAAGT